MPEGNIWLWITAASGIIGTAWAYVSGWGRQLTSYLIVTVDVTEKQSGAVQHWFNSNLARSRYGHRTYTGQYIHVRSKSRVLLVAAEDVSEKGKLYWKGWRPVWLRETEKPNGESRISLTYIRGTFNSDELMQDAAEALNLYSAGDEDSDGQKHRRHSISWVSGSVGREFMHASQVGHAPSAPSGYASEMPGSCKENFIGKRLLGYKYDDLGAGDNDPHSAIVAMAMTEPMAEFYQEVRQWLDAGQWHKDRSIPWRLSAMLHGEPGNGKTSFVRAVSEELDLPLFAFDLPTLHNDEFRSGWRGMLSHAPCVALIEDVDSMFKGREKIQGELTFDCLLNCLDGIERADGLLLLVTTNKLYQLDEALTRPGRIDRIVEFTRPNEDGRRQIANRILNGFESEVEQIVVEGIDDTGAEFQDRCVSLARKLFWENRSLVLAMQPPKSIRPKTVLAREWESL